MSRLLLNQRTVRLIEATVRCPRCSAQLGESCHFSRPHWDMHKGRLAQFLQIHGFDTWEWHEESLLKFMDEELQLPD